MVSTNQSTVSRWIWTNESAPIWQLLSTWHWNLQRRRLITTRKARPARLARMMKMVCSSLVGELELLWPPLS